MNFENIRGYSNKQIWGDDWDNVASYSKNKGAFYICTFQNLRYFFPREEFLLIK